MKWYQGIFDVCRRKLTEADAERVCNVFGSVAVAHVAVQPLSNFGNPTPL